MNVRLTRIKQLLAEQSLDACLISSVPNITYLTNYSNFSTEEREAYLFITHTNQYVLTDGRYSKDVEKKVKEFRVIEISGAYSFKKAIQKIAKTHNIKKLGIEESNISVTEYKMLSSCLNDLKHLNMDSLRIKKGPSEIEAIEKACKLGDKTFDYILKQITHGVTEKQLAFKLEYFIKEHGADISFPPIIAFGANSAIPHHQTSDQILSTNDLILLDFGVKIDNYCSDMTRTVFLGRVTAGQKRMYETVLDAQQRATEYIEKQYNKILKPFGLAQGGRVQNDKGINASIVDKIARDFITSKNYPSIPHSLGHGIGLQVHEPPTLSPVSLPEAGQILAEKHTLSDGMVFSIEPGIYQPDNQGVRIEDLFVIEKTGLRQLTNAPKRLTEL